MNARPPRAQQQIPAAAAVVTGPMEEIHHVTKALSLFVFSAGKKSNHSRRKVDASGFITETFKLPFPALFFECHSITADLALRAGRRHLNFC